ncbi:MAG: serine hydrolase [Candidatus Latescibacterota bacterium]|nr:serine hydrolase [Candidatus Latescibacterota bacterium]
MPLSRSNPEAQGISSKAILRFIRSLEEKTDSIHSFVLLRHSRIVADGWWLPYRREFKQEIYSLTKSFTSTAVGIAVSEGLISIDDPVHSFFSTEQASFKRPIKNQDLRIRHLLTMSSGHHIDALWPIQQGGDWTNQILSTDIRHSPGTYFLYNEGASYLLSVILTRVTGKKLIDYLRPRLFDKLEINNPSWEESPEDVNLGGWGLRITTENIANFGQLYLQNGIWDNQQLIPSQWVSAATSHQISIGTTTKNNCEQGYGYQFWTLKNDAYAACGAFGQYCIVVPKEKLVLAITAGTNNTQSILNILWEELIPYLNETLCNLEKDKTTQLRRYLSNLTLPPQKGVRSVPMEKKIIGRFFSFESNKLGIKEISFNFDPNIIKILKEDGSRHSLLIGYKSWEMNNSIGIWPWEQSSEPGTKLLAISGAWESNEIYIAKLYFCDTPHSIIIHFQFTTDQIFIQEQHHVSFETHTRKPLVGNLID